MLEANEIFGLERQVHEIWTRLRAGKLSVDEIRLGLQSTMEGNFRPIPELFVTPNTDRSLQEIRVALGEKRWNTGITSDRFSLTQGRLTAQKLELYQFPWRTRGDVADQILDLLGYERVAELPVIAAFFEEYPEVDSRFWIVTGAHHVDDDGRRHALTSYQGSGILGIGNGSGGDDWPSRCRFLIRRK